MRRRAGSNWCLPVRSVPAASAEAVEALVAAFAKRLANAGLAFGHGTDNAGDEALRLVLDGLRGGALTAAARSRLEGLLERRVRERLPVPYLTGQAWFFDTCFAVGPGVMVPRSPIAEVLANGVQPWLESEPKRVLDLGCGCGALGIAAARVFPAAAVDLVDVDALALASARRNVGEAGLSARVNVVESDLFANLAERRYDLILCNPPYVPTSELDAAPAEFQHEPRLGLDGGADGLAVWRRILADLDAHLTVSGVLVGEVGNGRRAFEAAFPALAPVWLDLDHAEPQADGGFGVFVLSAELRRRLAQSATAPPLVI